MPSPAPPRPTIFSTGFSRRSASASRAHAETSILICMRAFFSVLVPAVAALAQSPDLILHNGKIVTGNSAAPTAQTLAIRGGRIAAIGSEAEIRRQAGPSTRLIDLHGMLAIPGFIEGHGHF